MLGSCRLNVTSSTVWCYTICKCLLSVSDLNNFKLMTTEIIIPMRTGRYIHRSSHRRCSVKFRKIYRKTSVPESFLNKAAGWGLQLYKNKDSGIDVFLWILRNFWERFSLQNTSGGCFCTLRNIKAQGVTAATCAIQIYFYFEMNRYVD